MKEWHNAIKAAIVMASILIIILSLSTYAMPSDKQDSTSDYRVEYVTPESSKLRLSGEAFRGLDPGSPLVATVRVSQEGYVPSGVEVRTWIGSSIFTANISKGILAQLEQDPLVVSIEPVYDLRSQ
jgi:hypothetical protein